MQPAREEEEEEESMGQQKDPCLAGREGEGGCKQANRGNFRSELGSSLPLRACHGISHPSLP